VVKVKICGITSVGDAKAAVAAGADAIGLVFFAPSPRNIANFAIAREIALSVGPFVTVVGLVVNPERGFLDEILRQVPLHVIQFHGDEDEPFCASFCRPFIKAVRMKPGLDIGAVISSYPSACGILLDTYKKGVPGGTGETFNWELVPADAITPIVLAGGLIPENIAAAVRIVSPYGVDVSGGVESSPGIKDKNKIKAFIDNAHAEFKSEH
jgi:phosphoribosylanthranilate isomerase (EC 5.3.1.24)